MVTIYVENRPYQVNQDQNLLHNCLTLGFNLPYFCWHPAMGSVGACRQCAVKVFKDEKDQKGRLVMACMTPAAAGTRLSIRDPEAAAFRAAVIEGLMLNHPHDCPVCDEGGECHLQDMTVMTGHDYRGYRFNKRTFRNQYLGPLVNHEMNRCIQCYRCVRFYREYAGGHDLNSFALRNIVFFGREKDGVLENEFSGNLVEVCPTGVFTDATLKRHYTRKWDLQMAPSICVHCALGCNITSGERYGMLRRTLNRYNGEVNGYFLCDRGRYGYEFVNSNRRIRRPQLRRDGKAEWVTKSDALKHLSRGLTGGGTAIGIGSPRASLEANFALRALVGAEHFYQGVSDEDFRLVSSIVEIARTAPVLLPSLKEVERSDAVFVLGEDVTNFAPRLALSVRQALREPSMRLAGKLRIPLWLDHAVREAGQDTKAQLFVAAPNATRLDEVATETCYAAPDDIARIGFGVAHALDQSAPDVICLTNEQRALAGRIAGALENSERPLIISGPSCRNSALILAAANVAQALHRGGRQSRLVYTLPECNSFGLSLLGGRSLGSALEEMAHGRVGTVIILENDLYRRAPAALVDSALEKTRLVAVLDHLENRTTARANLLLPAAAFAESEGTLVSSEGRAQRFFRVYVPEGEIEESWRLLHDLATETGSSPEAAWRNLDDVIAAIAAEIPVLAPIKGAAPGSGFRTAGARVPREPHRYSGRTAMLANISVHEPKPPEDFDSPLSFSMEGAPTQPPSPLTPFFWAPGWNSIQATNTYQREIGGPLRGGDPGVRLVEPPEDGQVKYFDGVPGPFQPRPDEWLLVPLHHIFGSEELSLHAPGIAELSPGPYLALNTEDSLRLQLGAGAEASLKITGTEHRLPVRIERNLPRGIAGIPAGLTQLEGVALPIWGRISKV